MVVGTGDMSELALDGDLQRRPYVDVRSQRVHPENAGPPPRSYAASISPDGLRAVLEDIVATPVSPELLPPDEAGRIAQKTEEIVGPYELHDFFLYYMSASDSRRPRSCASRTSLPRTL
jgi:NAD+ synthase (glutamine-hydrolysing)